MLNRVLIGSLIFALFVAANFANPIIWTLFLLSIALIAFFEFKNLCDKMSIKALNNLIIFFIVVFYITPIMIQEFQPEILNKALCYKMQLSLLVSAFTLTFPSMLLKSSGVRFEDISASLWAIIHLALLPSFFVWMRLLDNGFELIMIIVMTVAMNDIASMLLGKAFGRIPLSPKISPNKTVFGGLAGMALAAYLFSSLMQYQNLHLNTSFLPWQIPEAIVLFLLGTIIAALAQVGDLLMSVLKREAGVKDSGTVLLSHGGILDRVDSHFFVGWFAYFLFGLLI